MTDHRHVYIASESEEDAVTNKALTYGFQSINESATSREEKIVDSKI